MRFEGCGESSGASFSNTTVQLTRENSWFQPDENRGQQTLACRIFDQGSWGRQLNPGDYHFTVVKINGASSGWYRLDVDDVLVRY